VSLASGFLRTFGLGLSVERCGYCLNAKLPDGLAAEPEIHGNRLRPASLSVHSARVYLFAEFQVASARATQAPANQSKPSQATPRLLQAVSMQSGCALRNRRDAMTAEKTARLKALERVTVQ